MKLGITTNVFAGPIKTGEVDLAKVLSFVRPYGVRSVEIRDDGASLEVESLRALRSIAEGMGINLSYAIKNDMTAEGDMLLLERAARLASEAGGRAVLRVFGAQELLKPPGKTCYSVDEGTRIAQVAEGYGRVASGFGARIAIENAREPLYGHHGGWGMAELIGAVTSHNVGLTFDPANATSKALCKSPASEEEVLRFASEFAKRIFLVHYKTTSGGEVQPFLGEGDVGSERLFEALSGAPDPCLCVEIPGSPRLAETAAAVERSFEYLRRPGLVRFF